MTQMQLETKRRNKFFLSIQQNGDRTVGWREQQNRRRENPLEWRVDGDDPTNCLKKRNFSSRLFVSPFERVLKTIQKRTRLIYSKCSLSSPLEKERERERKKKIRCADGNERPHGQRTVFSPFLSLVLPFLFTSVLLSPPVIRHGSDGYLVFLFLLSVVCYLLFFFFVSFPIFCFFLVSSGGRLDLEASKAISALDNVSPYGYGLALCVCVCVDIEAATRALRWVAPRTTTAERERGRFPNKQFNT